MQLRDFRFSWLWKWWLHFFWTCYYHLQAKIGYSEYGSYIFLQNVIEQTLNNTVSHTTKILWTSDTQLGLQEDGLLASYCVAHVIVWSRIDQTLGWKAVWPFAQFDKALITQCVDFLMVWVKLRKDSYYTRHMYARHALNWPNRRL